MIYLVQNGPMQTTAAFAKVGTGTSIKTMFQLKTFVPCKILEWGYSFDGFTAGTPGQVELIETGSINATVTASAAADITGVDGEALLFGDPTTNYISVGTAATGYTASVEGSITATRNLGGTMLAPPTGPFVQQAPQMRECMVQAGKFVRVRVTEPAGVNMNCYLVLAF